MDIGSCQRDCVTVITIVGDIDGKSAPEVQARVLDIVQQAGAFLLDLSGVAYMSSAGLRMLLSVYRQAAGLEAQIALAGVCEDLQETMSATGFLKFFTLYESVEEVQAELWAG